MVRSPFVQVPSGLKLSESLSSPTKGDDSECEEVSTKLRAANLETVMPKKTPPRSLFTYFYAAEKLRNSRFLVHYQDRSSVTMTAAEFLPLATRYPGKKQACQALIPGIKNLRV